MAGGFAPGQKAAVTGQLPDFCEQRGTGLGKGDPRVGAGIEEADFDRAHFRLDLGEEPLHGLFAAQVGADGSRDAAGRLDLPHNCARFVGIAPGDADGMAAVSEPSRHRRPDRVSGTGQQCYAIPGTLAHSQHPLAESATAPYSSINELTVRSCRVRLQESRCLI